MSALSSVLDWTFAVVQSRLATECDLCGRGGFEDGDGYMKTNRTAEGSKKNDMRDLLRFDLILLDLFKKRERLEIFNTNKIFKKA